MPNGIDSRKSSITDRYRTGHETLRHDERKMNRRAGGWGCRFVLKDFSLAKTLTSIIKCTLPAWEKMFNFKPLTFNFPA
jgi:hypothetical protein